jgi:hypothetical protein
VSRWTGRDVYRLKVVTLRGNEQFELYDAENGLQVAVEASRDTPLGIVPSVALMKEYQKYGSGAGALPRSCSAFWARSTSSHSPATSSIRCRPTRSICRRDQGADQEVTRVTGRWRRAALLCVVLSPERVRFCAGLARHRAREFR